MDTESNETEGEILSITDHGIEDKEKRILEKGYDETRSHGEKQAVVRRLGTELWREHDGKHRRLGILKKDLKRRHLEAPGVPLPAVKRRPSRKQVWEVSSSEEARPSGQQHAPSSPEESMAGVQGGPSPQPASPPQVSDDREEELITTSHKELLKEMHHNIEKLKREQQKAMQAFREQHLQELREIELEFANGLRQIEEQQSKDMAQLKKIVKKLRALSY